MGVSVEVSGLSERFLRYAVAVVWDRAKENMVCISSPTQEVRECTIDAELAFHAITSGVVLEWKVRRTS